MNLCRLLDERVSAALREAAGDPQAPALVAPSSRPELGDYQANGVMAAAKRLKTNPRKLAEHVVAALAPGGAHDLSDLAEKIDIAGPGFLNIRLRPQWLAHELGRLAGDESLGVEKPSPPQRIVVDYSAPNLAKEMHVGHLRSTIIGDALARTLEFVGHDVKPQNHVGDWGMQFGMLVAHFSDVQTQTGELKPDLKDLEQFYIEAKKKYDTDPQFNQIARRDVVLLQGGNDTYLTMWKLFRSISLEHCNRVYRRLGVLLHDADIRGESAYNDDLPKVVEDLQKGGLLTESQGAMCVFLDQFKGKDGQPLPLIVQKSDEGYLYATTDLAAIRYRVRELKADRVLYVVDARQSLHFKQVFAVARAAGFAPEAVALEHVAFGTMMGPDGKPFKTRQGGTVKLMDLLDEAEKRAYDLVSNKNPELPEEQRREISRKVGIGAVKYADLSQNRHSDYVFSWEKMLALDGNTAPYMQYAYARIQSIFRKGEKSAECGVRSAAKSAVVPARRDEGGSAKLSIAEPSERALALKLLQFSETLATVAQECLPNVLCTYLYDLAVAFTGFYENCPVLQSPEPTRTSRLILCRLTANVIRKALDLLGIQTVEQM